MYMYVQYILYMYEIICRFTCTCISREMLTSHRPCRNFCCLLREDGEEGAGLEFASSDGGQVSVLVNHKQEDTLQHLLPRELVMYEGKLGRASFYLLACLREKHPQPTQLPQLHLTTIPLYSYTYIRARAYHNLRDVIHWRRL